MSGRGWFATSGSAAAIAVTALIPDAPLWQRLVACLALIVAIVTAGEGFESRRARSGRNAYAELAKIDALARYAASFKMGKP